MNELSKFYLHDAVYLYLRVINQTLAEGYTDYRDGRLILSKTIGQRFVGKHKLEYHFIWLPGPYNVEKFW